jgi:hypothetical protein
VPRRINAGQAMVVVGGLALFASLFVDWYEVGPLEEGVSAWTVFEIADLVLAGLAILAIASAVPVRLGGAPEPRPLLDPRWSTWLGVAALVLVIVTLINDPPAVRDRPLEVGGWIGLAGAVLLAAGGVLSGSRISIVISSRANVPPERVNPADPVEPEAGEPLAEEPIEPVEEEATEPVVDEETEPLADDRDTQEWRPPEDERT